MTQTVGPYDYDALLVRSEAGYQTEIYERRRQRLVVNSQGHPQCWLPDYVAPDAWSRYVGQTDKIVWATRLIRVSDDQLDSACTEAAPEPDAAAGPPEPQGRAARKPRLVAGLGM